MKIFHSTREPRETGPERRDETRSRHRRPPTVINLTRRPVCASTRRSPARTNDATSRMEERNISRRRRAREPVANAVANTPRDDIMTSERSRPGPPARIFSNVIRTIGRRPRRDRGGDDGGSSKRKKSATRVRETVERARVPRSRAWRSVAREVRFAPSGCFENERGWRRRPPVDG